MCAKDRSLAHSRRKAFLDYRSGLSLCITLFCIYFYNKHEFYQKIVVSVLENGVRTDLMATALWDFWMKNGHPLKSCVCLKSPLCACMNENRTDS